VGDVVVDECMSCRGLVLDEIAVKRIVTDRQQARAESLLGALPKLDNREKPPERSGGKLYIKCPVCKVVMNRKLFASGTGIIIDVCRSHGTFFDAGELPIIIEFVMNGGLEKQQKKDLERMRDQIKRESRSMSMPAVGGPGASDALLTSPMTDRFDAGGALVSLLSSLFR
jgi:Zn-finger nucleic acid-binding protein